MAPWIMAVASFLQKSNEEKKQREQTRQNILNQYAESMGGGGPELQAAELNKSQRGDGMANILPLIQLFGSMGNKGGGGWQSQADYTGRGHVTPAGYAGRISTRDF